MRHIVGTGGGPGYYEKFENSRDAAELKWDNGGPFRVKPSPDTPGTFIL